MEEKSGTPGKKALEEKKTLFFVVSYSCRCPEVSHNSMSYFVWRAILNRQQICTFQGLCYSSQRQVEWLISPSFSLIVTTVNKACLQANLSLNCHGIIIIGVSFLLDASFHLKKNTLKEHYWFRQYYK